MFNEQDRVPVVIFSLGSLQVYALQTMQEAYQGAPANGFYWRDAASPQGYGPFNYISTAMEHYQQTIGMFKTAKAQDAGEPRMADVIRVDFQGKKRV